MNDLSAAAEAHQAQAHQARRPCGIGNLLHRAAATDLKAVEGNVQGAQGQRRPDADRARQLLERPQAAHLGARRRPRSAAAGYR